MKLKKVIVSIVVCLFVVVFVVPSPHSYLSEVNISGEKKKRYSLYKSVSISNKLKAIPFTNQLPKGIKKYDITKLRYGSPSYSIVIKEDSYRFFRLSSESDVLVTKTNENKIKAYARMNKKSYQKLASTSNYTQYEELDYWN